MYLFILNDIIHMNAFHSKALVLRALPTSGFFSFQNSYNIVDFKKTILEFLSILLGKISSIIKLQNLTWVARVRKGKIFTSDILKFYATHTCPKILLHSKILFLPLQLSHALSFPLSRSYLIFLSLLLSHSYTLLLTFYLSLSYTLSNS